MSDKIIFKTLGCRLNQFETDALAKRFELNGYEVAESGTDADVLVVNTCTVTNQSNQKSRTAINQLQRKNRNAKLFITGCMAVSHKAELEQLFPLAHVVDNKQKSAIYHKVDSILKGTDEIPLNETADLFSYESVTELFHTRSMVKIQDGCDNFCTFCIIPFVRGRATSRPPQQIISNVQDLVAKGAKEIVLTGVNIGRYSIDGLNFSALVEQILEVEGDFRVRISSIEPDGFDERFFKLVHHPKMTPHLHLCLQSGSDRVLLQMRRMYTTQVFRETVERIRLVNPLFNFTTDVIVGFPGESDDDFTQTLDFCRTMQFGHIHIFKYSDRNDTRASRMSDKVSGKVMKLRSQQLHELAENLKREYRLQLLNVPQTVLVEKSNNGLATGYSEFFVPHRIAGCHVARNKFVEVRCMELADSEIISRDAMICA